MKKHKLVCLILCIGILISAMFVGASATSSPFTPNDPRNDVVDAGILLYMGYGGYNIGNKYTRFTDNDLDQLVQLSEDFILLTIPNYNWYYDANGVRQSILNMDDVRNIRPTRDGATWANGGADTNIVCSCVGAGPDWDRMFAYGFASRPDNWEFDCQFLWEMWHYARNMTWMLNTPTMTLQGLVADYLDVAVRLADRNPNVRLWLSFPATEHMHILTYRFTPYWIEHIIYGSRDALYEMGRPEIWHNNIVGFYYGNEEIVPFYTPFNRHAHTNPDRDYLDNSVVWGMRELADVIRDELGLKFLWIPTVNIRIDDEWTYAPITSIYNTSLEVVGLLANQLNIFDAIILQPNYYFRDDGSIHQYRTRRQVWAIREWVQNQVITHPSTMGNGEWVNRPGDGAYVTDWVWNPDLGDWVPVMEWNPYWQGFAWSFDGGYDTSAIWNNAFWSYTGGWCIWTWEATGVWTQVTSETVVVANPQDFWNDNGGIVWTTGRFEQAWIWDPTLAWVQWSDDGGYDIYAMYNYFVWWQPANGWCYFTWWSTGEWIFRTNSRDVIIRDPADFWNDNGGYAWVASGGHVPHYEWDDNAGAWEEITEWDPNAGEGIMWVPDQLGTPIGGAKVSTTQIGFHMELEFTAVTNPSYRDRWLTYVAAFRDLLGFAPSAVYSGPPEHTVAVIPEMDAFFNNDRGGGGTGITSQPESTPESNGTTSTTNDPTSGSAPTSGTAPGGTDTGNNPQSGDYTPIAAGVAILTISTAAIVATKRRKTA